MYGGNRAGALRPVGARLRVKPAMTRGVPFAPKGRCVKENFMISLENVGVSFNEGVCFEGVFTSINSGCRVGIIGDNGAGKSSLLRVISGELTPSQGAIKSKGKTVLVPQIIRDFPDLSGGQRFNKSLSLAFSYKPDFLLLDEPTNHLDVKNKNSLMKMINNFSGGVIVASHDEQLLRNCINTFWHICSGKINIFSGHYDDYIQSLSQKRNTLLSDIDQIKKDKKLAHKSLMKEQARSKASADHGKKLVAQKRWIPAIANAKASTASLTAGKKNAALVEKRRTLSDELSNLKVAQTITPTFSLNAKAVGNKTLLYISQGCAGYLDKKVLENLTLSLAATQHLAITGDNGSGKTTLFKAILNDPSIIKSGIWDVPDRCDIGYLDQNYSDLYDDKTVFENIEPLMAGQTYIQIRNLLMDFLFKKNEEVNKPVTFLSGGQRARLALCKIAAASPKLLLIDEITNNIDIQTKNHCAQVLRNYPGAMMIISHDESFLESIAVGERFLLGVH
jgi:ATPase subunit of ABC transporter with duplicated ATPase domains